MMETARLADAALSRRRMFVRDLVMEARIGVHAHEHGRTQRIRVNLDLAVDDDGARPLSRQAVGRDVLTRVVDYEHLVNAARELIVAGHVQLVETLAERLAELCLADRRVALVRVRVEKLDVFPDAEAVGVEIERRR
ncbi:dihydroneopterin aldolase [Acidiphilium sp. AL]|uniref:7,8-dihydroneopterin aldolase n=2 Tax=Acidocellaceae TaxID=3385905 RepID=A0ABS9DUB7_9PROT|nr:MULTISPECIES: dihydroneopterin aldolase [Acidiphilium]MCF3946320.1 dihydroneopterin aldolase [Acidiphilium iwatense]MCU4159896.1 dihydroneopterin aldolase [Acidiphilium sp. AL]